MPAGDQGIARIRLRNAVGCVELLAMRRAQRAELQRPATAGHASRDAQHVTAEPRLDGRRGAPDHAGGRRTPQLDRIEVFERHAQRLADHGRPEHAVGIDRRRRQETVDFLLVEACILGGLTRQPGDDAEGGQSFRLSGRWKLRIAGDGGRGLERHEESLSRWLCALRYRRRPTEDTSRNCRGLPNEDLGNDSRSAIRGSE
jgi:hypothetical protein